MPSDKHYYTTQASLSTIFWNNVLTVNSGECAEPGPHRSRARDDAEAVELCHLLLLAKVWVLCRFSPVLLCLGTRTGALSVIEVRVAAIMFSSSATFTGCRASIVFAGVWAVRGTPRVNVNVFDHAYNRPRYLDSVNPPHICRRAA
jgi:hypothetical protein